MVFNQKIHENQCISVFFIYALDEKEGNMSKCTKLNQIKTGGRLLFQCIR